MIKEYELVDLEIAKLISDSENPNIVSDEQMDAMRESMNKFGFLAPILVDQNMKIADGEHRVDIYKEMGKTTIKGFVVNLENDIDRRLIRQTMNKLRGQHDEELDVAEFIKIQEAGSLEELSKLIASSEDEIVEMIDRVSARDAEQLRDLDQDPFDGRMDAYLYGSIRQVVLYFKLEEYDEVIEKLQVLMEKHNLQSNTDVIKKLLSEA